MYLTTEINYATFLLAKQAGYEPSTKENNEVIPSRAELYDWLISEHQIITSVWPNHSNAFDSAADKKSYYNYQQDMRIGKYLTESDKLGRFKDPGDAWEDGLQFSLYYIINDRDYEKTKALVFDEKPKEQAKPIKDTSKDDMKSVLRTLAADTSFEVKSSRRKGRDSDKALTLDDL